MIKQQIHRDSQASVWWPSFPRKGDVWSCRLSPDPGQHHKRGELPKRERYVRQVSDLKIPTTDLPFPSYSRHISPQCDTWLRTPRCPYRCVPLIVVTAVIGFWTCLTELKNCPGFSFLILPTILPYAVLAHLISNYPWCACATRTALL